MSPVSVVVILACMAVTMAKPIASNRERPGAFPADLKFNRYVFDPTKEVHSGAGPFLKNVTNIHWRNNTALPADTPTTDAPADKDANSTDVEARQRRNDRTKRWDHAPAASPPGFPKGAIVIMLRWDPTDDGGHDLDSILLDPQGCITCGKSGQGICWDNNGFSELGGYANAVWVTPHGGSTSVYSNLILDSKYNTAPAGVESIIIYKPDTSGIYHHLVYQYGSYAGFVMVMSATVDVWVNDATMWPHIVHEFVVWRTPAFGNTCTGRFWNTFSISFTVATGDDDAITSYTLVPKMVITTTPEYTFGTTDWFQWENYPRTDLGCTYWNTVPYYYTE